MKGSDKAIVLGVVMAVVLAGFYLKVLSPKREEASSLGEDINKLESQIDEQKQTAQYGEQARHQFPTYYGRLVVLGKAVPARADTASLMVQLSGIAHRTDVQFRGITLGAGSGDEEQEQQGAAAHPQRTRPDDDRGAGKPHHLGVAEKRGAHRDTSFLRRAR